MSKQIERITQMEAALDDLTAVRAEFLGALKKFKKAQAQYTALSEYYGGDQWGQDFYDDEAGKLPKDLKRGVLSEDGLYDLLFVNRDLLSRLSMTVSIAIETGVL